MTKVYCTKCGIRGTSKCPHCRSVFGSSPKDEKQRAAQEYFEMFLTVGLVNNDDRPKVEAGEEVRHKVSFWTYDASEEAAIKSILGSLTHYLPLADLTIAACVHDWQLKPGERSTIGCGHEGAPKGTPIPDNPYK